MSNPYDTTGQKCTLFYGEPCPGKAIMECGDEVGCPYWRTITITPDNGTAVINWTGCGIMMDPDLLTGLTHRVHSAAAAIESNRNAVEKLVVDIEDKIGQGFNDMAHVMVEGIKAQQLHLFDKITESKKLSNGQEIVEIL